MYGRIAILSFVAGAGLGTLTLFWNQTDNVPTTGSTAGKTDSSTSVEGIPEEPRRLVLEDARTRPDRPRHDLQLAAHVLLDEIPDSYDSSFDATRFKPAQLTYDGRTFEEWRTKLLTELKPESRLEAADAVLRFGMNGRGREAIEAMLQVLDGYSFFSWHQISTADPESAIDGAIEFDSEEELDFETRLLRKCSFSVLELAAFSLSSSDTGVLESRARASWRTGLSPVIALGVLCRIDPDRGGQSLLHLLRDETQSEIHDLVIDEMGRTPAWNSVLAELIELAREKPEFQSLIIWDLECNDGTRALVVPFACEVIQTGENLPGARQILTESGALKALAEREDLTGFGVTDEEILTPKLADVLVELLEPDVRNPTSLYVGDLEDCLDAARVLGRLGAKAAHVLPLLKSRATFEIEPEEVRVQMEAAIREIEAAVSKERSTESDDGPDEG